LDNALYLYKFPFHERELFKEIALILKNIVVHY